MVSVSTHSAIVRNGRLVLDEPTDLPEGTRIELEEAASNAEVDDLDEEEQARLHASLERSWQQAQQGQHGRPFADILKDL